MDIGLPKWEDIYEGNFQDFEGLRTLNMLKTENERQMSMGEDYDLEPVPFGKCLIQTYWTFHKELIIYKFRFDYF